MEVAGIALALLDLASKLAERAKQSGEMTPEQETAFALKCADAYMRYAAAPPPPPGT